MHPARGANETSSPAEPRACAKIVPIRRATETLDAPTTGKVFKIARRPSGEKIVYLRLFAGCLAARGRTTLRRRDA